MKQAAAESIFWRAMGHAQRHGVDVRKFLDSRRFVCHELDHMRRTAVLAGQIAAVTPGADVLGAILGGAFHDIGRENDGHDPHHGPRGARLVARHRLLDPWLGRIRDPNVVLFAIQHHSDPFVTDDPTAGAVWDADRLELRRAGELPDLARFSTVEGKRRARRFLAMSA